MGRRPRAAPAAGVEGWPERHVDDVDVEHVRRIALALREAIGDRSIRSVASEVGVGHQALSDLLAGRTWPEVATVARIERGLGCRLWPD